VSSQTADYEKKEKKKRTSFALYVML